MIRLAINGAGRIGRACARIVLGSKNIKLVAINDPAGATLTKHLIRYDSVHRATSYDLDSIKFTEFDSPDKCNFDADIVLECSGKFLTADQVNAYITNGAQRVIISAVPQDNTPIAKYDFLPPEQIISAGSCTTNALDLIVRTIDKSFGVNGVLATSIHSYTSDQRLLDSKHPYEMRRARSATQNIIPVATSAASNLAKISPKFAHKAEAIGLRVPTPNVSIMQVALNLEKFATVDQLNHAFLEEAKIVPHHLSVSFDSKCSTDIMRASYSAIIDAKLTMVSGNLASITAWHDNEYGYAARVVELAQIQTNKRN